MCDRSLTLRALVNERLTAAAEEIFALVERTIAEYEEELCRSKEENQRKQQLLDSVLVPQVRVVRTQGVQMDLSPGPGVKQEVPETIRIKQEPEEQSSNIIISDVFSLWDGSKNTDHSANEPFSCPNNKDSPVKVHPKTKKHSSVLERRPTRKKSQNQRRKGLHSETEEQTDNDEDWGPPASSSTAQMETEADGDHYNQVQIKDTSTAAHNSGLFSKYKCGAESRATVTEGHQSGTAAGGRGGRGGGDKKYECSVCKNRFVSVWTLKRHIRLHTGERPYSCSVCKKTFAQQTSLDYHARVHTGEKPYSCTVCKKTFSQNGNLHKHMTIHTGGKPYSCTVCEKTFSQNSNLNIHMRIHTGERPYSCLRCKKTFAYKVSLNFHMRQHKTF